MLSNSDSNVNRRLKDQRHDRKFSVFRIGRNGLLNREDNQRGMSRETMNEEEIR
jgi:hypothetical protein